ncbi:MAG: hypothetical protein LBG74_07910, partial [Spirochaetaceae bacterium]|nr:hypothetical protein [Spirochaetaceae bacterium]
MKEFTGINLFCCLVFAAFCLVYTACAEPAEPEPASSSIKIDMRVDAAGGETKGVYEIPVNTSSAIEISGLNS